MARRTKKGSGELQKVFGTLAVFSTASGNGVGSSIYYAVGPTAEYSDTPSIITSNRGYQPEQEWQ